MSGHDEETAPVVAAAAGMAAVVISPMAPEDDLDGRPNAVNTRHVWVVAWRLMYGGAAPVLVEVPPSDATVFVIMPDGKLTAPEEGTFSSVENAGRAVLTWAQGRWDRAQTRRAKAAA
jgi:hypothetical protein